MFKTFCCYQTITTYSKLFSLRLSHHKLIMTLFVIGWNVQRRTKTSWKAPLPIPSLLALHRQYWGGVDSFPGYYEEERSFHSKPSRQLADEDRIRRQNSRAKVSYFHSFLRLNITEYKILYKLVVVIFSNFKLGTKYT